MQGKSIELIARKYKKLIYVIHVPVVRKSDDKKLNADCLRWITIYQIDNSLIV
jgi:hypothetical protein